MLNGLYPVIILQKIKNPNTEGTFENGKITNTDASGITLGKPIPIYLHEDLTGIGLVSQSRRVEIATDPIISAEEEQVIVKQRGITNGVDIVLRASRNSIGINLLLPLMDIAFEKSAAGDYLISYFNTNVILFRSKLKSFSSEENDSSTEVFINISLEKEEASKKEDKTSVHLALGDASGIR